LAAAKRQVENEIQIAKVFLSVWYDLLYFIEWIGQGSVRLETYGRNLQKG
jgi:hypothetical protein